MTKEIRKIELGEDIFLLENILSKGECEALIDSSEKVGYEEATIFDGKSHRMLKSVRNNLRLIADDSVFADEIWKKVSGYFNESIFHFKAIGLNERFRFYKYEPGHRFNKHKDGAFVRSESERSIHNLFKRKL